MERLNIRFLQKLNYIQKYIGDTNVVFSPVPLIWFKLCLALPRLLLLLLLVVLLLDQFGPSFAHYWFLVLLKPMPHTSSTLPFPSPRLLYWRLAFQHVHGKNKNKIHSHDVFSFLFVLFGCMFAAYVDVLVYDRFFFWRSSTNRPTYQVKRIETK